MVGSICIWQWLQRYIGIECETLGDSGSSRTSIKTPPITAPAIAPMIGGIFKLFDTLAPNAAMVAGEIIELVKTLADKA